ncbi:MAG: DUF5317 domain-containing protein [Chloroflexi bacterium]|nr:DUF5317 domain-containing protein [Chloroflexota bacterium]
MKVRLGWLVIMALGLQLVAIFGISDPDALVAKKAIFAASGLMLLIGILPNLRLWSFRVLAAGLLLNSIVMAANGGLMPITPANAERVLSQDTLETGIEVGQTPPRTKGIVLEPEDTRLSVLSDVIYVPAPNSAVYSIGDVLLLAGLFTFLVEASYKVVLRRKIANRLESPANDRPQ